MAFCPNCGADVQGRYCAQCGKALDAGAPPAAPEQLPERAVGPAARGYALPENTAAALCYLLGLITGVVFLMLEPYNKSKLIRFHAWQSIFLHVATIIFVYAFSLIFAWAAWHLIPVIYLAIFVLWIYMMVKTYAGKKVVLPVIGDLAAKQA
jgi:uncharacterized membrane protein